MDTNDQSRLRDLEAENVELKRRLESLSHEPLPKGELVVQEFLIDSQSYGIPLEWLREVVHAVLTEPLAGAHPVVVGRFLYGNEPHSLIDLRRLRPAGTPPRVRASMSIALLTSNVGSFGLLVDALGSLFRILPDELQSGRAPFKARGVWASVVGRSGQMIHLLSPSSLAVEFDLPGPNRA